MRLFFVLTAKDPPLREAARKDGKTLPALTSILENVLQVSRTLLCV